MKLRTMIRLSRVASTSTLYGLIAAIALLAVPAVQCQTYRVLHSFSGVPDGDNPFGPVIRDRDGNLYGVTSIGGDSSCAPFGCGTVFEVDKTGAEKVLFRFSGNDGSDPSGRLLRDGIGNLFGATRKGGAFNAGTIFMLEKSGKETVLHSFTGGTDGNEPVGSLVTDGSGNLYGTTETGGQAGCDLGEGCGVVFKVDRSGKETVLYTFTLGTDGGLPPDGVIRDHSGNLYGTTQAGGSVNCIYYSVGGCGTVFKLSPDGTLTTVYAFLGVTDGDEPLSGVVRDEDGNLYGTTAFGGDLSCNDGFGCGVVFAIDSSGNETVLYTFHGTDGNGPNGIVRDNAGNLFGTTSGGGDLKCSSGAAGCGVVFSIDPNGKETILHKFAKTPDGEFPFSGLFLSAQDNLYGVTYYGGASGGGSVFKIHR